MNKKKNKTQTNFIYTEEFKTTTSLPTEEQLKDIFNRKYYIFIKRQESRNIIEK